MLIQYPITHVLHDLLTFDGSISITFFLLRITVEVWIFLLLNGWLKGICEKAILMGVFLRLWKKKRSLPVKGKKLILKNLLVKQVP